MFDPAGVGLVGGGAKFYKGETPLGSYHNPTAVETGPQRGQTFIETQTAP